jgi:thiaminase/transcriptional activator TenA
LGFCDEVREKADHIWDAIYGHPFVTGIGDGSLPLEKFKFYICQDYVFLIDYGKVFALAATKPSDPDTMGRFALFLHETLNVEMSLHRSYANQFGISPEVLNRTKPSAATLAYTGYLLRAAHQGTLGELSAALLPCMWSYSDIGRRLADRGEPEGQQHYVEWIRMYASQEFADAAGWTKELTDKLAAQTGTEERVRMEEAFIISSKYEYMFWDMAYRMEEWPI